MPDRQPWCAGGGQNGLYYPFSGAENADEAAIYLSRDDGHEALGVRRTHRVRTHTEEAFNRSREWIAQHEIFGPGGLGSGTYEQVIACVVQSPL